MIISRGIRSVPMLKCSSERWVCAPHSLSAGTSNLAEAVGFLAIFGHNDEWSLVLGRALVKRVRSGHR